MGLRGPAKKPTNLRVLEGNRGHQKLHKNEPKPTPVAPDMPDYLEPAARQVWQELAPELERLGLLTVVDGAAFADYCTCLVRLRQCEKDIAERGVLVPGKRGRGQMVKNPSLQAAREYRAALQRWSDKFGLTPSARASLSVPSKESEADDLLDC